jgi:hypothetical protein
MKPMGEWKDAALLPRQVICVLLYYLAGGARTSHSGWSAALIIHIITLGQLDIYSTVFSYEDRR